MLRGALLLIAISLTVCGASVIGGKPSGVAGEASQTKQYFIPYGQPPQPPVRFIPVNAVRRPPIRQQQGVAQQSSSSSGILSLIVAFFVSRFLTTTTTTTAAAATTRSPCVVTWGTWGDCNLEDARYRNRTCPTGVETERGDCSIECGEYSTWTACVTPTVVDEKRVRTRQCKSGFQTVTEACYSSTTQGYTSDGWYRLSNGYEYRYISAATDFDLAVVTCEGWDASSTLATVGARSGIIGTDLDAAGMGIADGVIYFVGATDTVKENTWIFKDGVVLLTAAITNWGQVTPIEPNGGTGENCMVWLQAGGATMTAGLGDAPCTSRPALCERKVPNVYRRYPPPADIAERTPKTKQLPVLPYGLPPRQPVRLISLTPVDGVQIRERQGDAQERIIDSRGVYSILLALIFNRLISATTTFTTSATPPDSSTVPPCGVSWGPWTSCDLDGARYRSRACPTGPETEEGVCFIDCRVWSTWSSCVTPSIVDEKRTRTRQCKTGYETEQEACCSSTTTGYTSDGWYRASNGYEYKYISTATTYELAVSTCEGMDANSMLATVGARSSDIGSGLDTQGMGIANGDIYYVGASDAITEDTWIFSDDVVLATGPISNWASGDPNGGTGENCMVWIQASSGVGDAGCSGMYTALCERVVS